jgi:sister-chromatid-cohesion protein PDS5
VPLIKLELINHVDFMKTKILDPDEKVRAATCKVYSQIDYETALHHVSENQLRAVAGRSLDKKVWSRLNSSTFFLLNTWRTQRIVRTEALNSVGKLFSLAYPEMYVFHPTRF